MRCYISRAQPFNKFKFKVFQEQSAVFLERLRLNACNRPLNILRGQCSALCGGRQDKQTVRRNDCVVGLMLDGLEATAERRRRSKLHLRQHLMSLCSYRALSASGSEPQCAIQSSLGAQQPSVFTAVLYFNAWFFSKLEVKVLHVNETPSCSRSRRHNTKIQLCFVADLLF